MAADRVGGKWLFGGGVFLSAIVALMTPDAATIHVTFLITLRILSGLGEGPLLPSIHALIARWSVPRYRSGVVTFIFAGVDYGIIVGMVVTGVLCDYVGWESAFYLFGTVGCIWFIAWFFLCFDSPPSHPRISTTELEYWQQAIGSEDLVTRPPTPWRQIFTSAPVWALAVAFFALSWSHTTLVTSLPTYMHDVLGFSMSKVGMFSAIPFFASIVMIPASGRISDWLRAPGRLSTTVVRKTLCVAGFLLAATFYILTAYFGCHRIGAVTTLFFVVFFLCFGMSSVVTNQLDLAPLHAGRIMGLTYFFANLSAIGAPLAMGALTYEKSTVDEWRIVFLLAAAILVVGAAVFVVFGSGQRQSWAEIGSPADEHDDTQHSQ